MRRVCKILKLWGSITMLMGTYNPMQNICNKLEKSSKTGQDKKSLISTFRCFLTATAKI